MKKLLEIQKMTVFLGNYYKMSIKNTINFWNILFIKSNNEKYLIKI